MTLHKFSTSFLRFGTAFAVTSVALSGCSTVKSISPFGSNVPYAQDIQPTMARPAVTEIPAFKPKPVEPPAPKPRPAPVIATPPAEAAKPAAPAEPATSAPPAASAPVAPPAPQSSAAPVQAPKLADAAPPPAPAAEKLIQGAVPEASVPEKAAPEKTAPEKSADADVGDGPSIPADHKKLSQDGAFPNLAQVPPRPVNMPTFAEAAALEKSLVANRDTAKNPSPDSPAAPAVDSEPTAVPATKSAVTTLAAAKVVAPRSEDRSPCLSGGGAGGALAATFHFDPGSAALTAGNLAILAEAMPTVRGAKGTIRVYGHGDSDAAPASRFDLAAARAQAVAQAVVGYGIPAPRIAVGVACADTAFAGASVQLYTES